MKTSYGKAVHAERLKLRRSPVWLAFIALPMISAFFGTFNYLNNIELLKSEWLSLWTQHSLIDWHILLLFMAFGAYPPQLEQLFDFSNPALRFVFREADACRMDDRIRKSMDFFPVLYLRPALRAEQSFPQRSC